MLIIWVAIRGSSRGAAQSASHSNFSTGMANPARINLDPPHTSLFMGRKSLVVCPQCLFWVSIPSFVCLVGAPWARHPLALGKWCFQPWITECQNGLDWKDPEDHLFPSPCHGQGCHPLAQVSVTIPIPCSSLQRCGR